MKLLNFLINILRGKFNYFFTLSIVLKVKNAALLLNLSNNDFN